MSFHADDRDERGKHEQLAESEDDSWRRTAAAIVEGGDALRQREAELAAANGIPPATIEEASEAFFAGRKTFHVTVRTTDRTTYAVEAADAEDAESIWYENSDQPIVFNRVLESTVTDVSEA